MVARANSRAFPVLLAFLVAAGGLATMTPAGAQPGPAEPPYVWPDVEGDVFPFGITPPAPLVSVPPTAPFDLREVGISGEDEVGLTFHLKVQNFRGDIQPPIFSDGAYYRVEFELEGTGTAYRIEWYPALPGLNGNPAGRESVPAQFCVITEGDPDEPFSSGCYAQVVTATIDWDQNRLEAYVTKSALMGQEPTDAVPPPAGLPLVTKGMRLAHLRGAVDRFFPVPMSDRAPDEAEGAPTPYILAKDTANLKIKLGLDRDQDPTKVEGDDRGGGGIQFGDLFGAGATGEVSVIPGVATLVPLRVENTNANKRLINLTATLTDSIQSGDWRLQIAPTVQVPSGSFRVVNLIVNATPTIQHRDSAVALIKGTSLGFADEIAAARLTLVASVPPGPDKKTLFFHAASNPDAEIEGTVCGVLKCGTEDAWMNTLEEDASATLDEGVPMEMFCCQPDSAQYRLRFALDTPLARDLVLDPTQPIEATLAFQTQLDFPAKVTLEVYTTANRKLLAATSATSTIKAGTPVTLSFVPLLDATRVAVEDERIEARLTVRSGLAGAGAASLLPQFLFVPGASSLAFPFVPDPKAPVVSLLAGPALLTLTPQTDVEQFLNPARTRIFNLTVLNEGIDADVASVDVLYDDAAWLVELRPGNRYSLPPGESARFAVLVRAPEGAKEGAMLHVLVNATSSKDPRVMAQIGLTAIVTSGIDIPDEAGLYQADAESQQRLVDEDAGGQSPGLGALAAVAALGFASLGAWRRRRA